MSDSPHYTLSLSCPDRVGIVARVAGFLAQHGGWIIEANHHADADTGRFFLRQQIRVDSLPFDLDAFRMRFTEIAQAFDMHWSLSDSRLRKRVVLMVSQQGHCLYDLLGRWRSGELAVDIPAVISNHEMFREFVEWHGIPFYYIPITTNNKPAAYAKVSALFERVGGDVLVLARYMQVLDAATCARFPGRIINIHHSFLPGFVGAKPYHQAYSRGVKLVGATCHYVTEDLDQGPIIEQDVLRVDHGDTPAELIRSGRDVEKAVLARGLRYHLEDRVLLNGQRTVVFR